jgi:hypothetical protein
MNEPSPRMAAEMRQRAAHSATGLVERAATAAKP